MATRRELTKAYAREYQRASKKAKGVMLDELCAATGWSRVNARRAIRQALARKGQRRNLARHWCTRGGPFVGTRVLWWSPIDLGAHGAAGQPPGVAAPPLPIWC